jgi:hypothetical protein
MASEIAPTRKKRVKQSDGIWRQEEQPAERGACRKCGAPTWFWPEDRPHLCASCAFNSPELVRRRIVK